MQNQFDAIITPGLYSYTLRDAPGFTSSTVSGTYLDEHSNLVLVQYYTVTSGASSLLDLYRNSLSSTSALLPCNAFCCVLDVTSGAVSVGFDGHCQGGVTGIGVHRIVLNQYATARLGRKPLRRQDNSIPDPNVFSTVLSFQSVSVGTSAVPLITSPNSQRKTVQINNPSSTAYLYLGYNSSVNSTSQFILRIDPMSTEEIRAGSGVDLWIIGSGTGLTVNVAEVC